MISHDLQSKSRDSNDPAVTGQSVRDLEKCGMMNAEGPENAPEEYEGTSPHRLSCDEHGVNIPLKQQLIAEVFGTMVLIWLGTSVCAQEFLQAKEPNLMAIHFGWAVAVCFGVLVSFKYSGAHLNPAVTLSFYSLGDFPLKHVLPYIGSQLIGSILGALMTFLFYIDQLDGNKNTASSAVFYTTKASNVSWGVAFLNECLATAFLMIGILSLGQYRNITVFHVASFVALVVFAIGVTMGLNTGYAINPARDFGPRLFTAMAGWNDTSNPFSNNSYYFLVPLLAPVVGGVIGSQVFKFAGFRG